MRPIWCHKLLWPILLSCAAFLARAGASPDGTSHNNFLSMFLSPLRETLGQVRGIMEAKQLPAVASLTDGLEELQARTFRLFARIYNKTYSADELPRRMRLFLERRKEIEDSVRAYAEGRLSFMMRENAYADWDERELKKLMGVAPPHSLAEMLPEDRQALAQPAEMGRQMPGGLRRVSRSTSGWQTESQSGEEDDERNLIVFASESIPANKDWRTSNCISAPINQLKCGACYAIATMSVIETMRCLRSNTAPVLSPQHIVDCATPRAGYQNFGCNGGWPTRVLRYLQDVGVAVRDKCYPFVWRQQMCRLNQVLNNERDILYHVAKTGPVVTVMRATDRFLYYGSGIFDDPTCSRRRDDVDHAIVIVGYGRENGQDYWLIKNSWGTREWGQMGYGKYRRGTNACSIGHWGWVVTS